LRISLIAALTRKHVIGLNNAMPWHLPADLQHFKAISMGKPILMGRKTFEAIGKALPGRQNIVISRNPFYTAPGCTVTHSLDSAIALANTAEEVMVIGGGQLFTETLPLAHRLYLTWIEAELNGDSFFPEWDPKEWQVLSQEKRLADASNAFDLEFVTLERI
jgi:dihydrofolate reductase